MHGIALFSTLAGGVVLIAALCSCLNLLPREARGLRALLVVFVVILTGAWLVIATHSS